MDEDEYLEARKQDPEFQRMVEEEMRKIAEEMQSFAVSEGIDLDPDSLRNMKKEVMYSPKKPYAAVATNNHVQDSDMRAYEREQQKNIYLQELDNAKAYNNRHQQSKYSGQNNRREEDDVDIEIFAKRPGYGRNRNAVGTDQYATKREKQELYARQLKEQADYHNSKKGEPDVPEHVVKPRPRPVSPIVTDNIVSNIGTYDNFKNSPDAKRQEKLRYAQQLADGAHAAPIDNGRYSLHAAKLDREKAMLEQEMLNPNAPRRRSEGAESGYSIGSANNTSEDRHRKQLAYAQQLHNDQRNMRRPSDAVQESPSKTQHYREMQEVYKREAVKYGGLNIGSEYGESRTGRRAGSNGGIVDEERRLKIEKQRQYAQSIEESAAAKPPSGHRVSRRKSRENSSYDPNAVPAYLEESPDRQVHSGRLRRPNDVEEEAMKKRIAQQEYYKQIQSAAAQAPIEKNRVCLQKLRAGSDFMDEPDEPKERRLFPPPEYGKDEIHMDALQVAKERILRLRREEQMKKTHDEELLAEEQYKQYRGTVHAGGSNYSVDAESYVPQEAISSPNSKYYSGGGGDRVGYRTTGQDAEYAGSGYPNPPMNRNNHMSNVMSTGYGDNSYDTSDSARLDSGRLSGRRSAHQYDSGPDPSNDPTEMDARAYKRLQQQKYRDEISRAAAAPPLMSDRKSTIRQQQEEINHGINLPGNYDPPRQEYPRGGRSGGGYTNFSLG